MGYRSVSSCSLSRGKNPPDVYFYDEIPTPLRNQIILLWNEIENSVVFEPYDLSDAVVRILGISGKA